MYSLKASLRASAPSQSSSIPQSVFPQRKKKISLSRDSASESRDCVTSISAIPKSRRCFIGVTKTRTLGNLFAEEKFEAMRVLAWAATSLGFSAASRMMMDATYDILAPCVKGSVFEIIDIHADSYAN